MSKEMFGRKENYVTSTVYFIQGAGVTVQRTYMTKGKNASNISFRGGFQNY